MALYSAGKLLHRKLVNIFNIPELREIEVLPGKIRIGASCTYTALRQHPVTSQEFPLLAAAASCTGAIANQNRGTRSCNIATASPRADSLPALLVYDAELVLVSVLTTRSMSQLYFHCGFRQTALAGN